MGNWSCQKLLETVWDSEKNKRSPKISCITIILLSIPYFLSKYFSVARWTLAYAVLEFRKRYMMIERRKWKKTAFILRNHRWQISIGIHFGGIYRPTVVFLQITCCKWLLTLELGSVGGLESQCGYFHSVCLNNKNTPQGSIIKVDTLCPHNFENNMLWNIEHIASCSIIVLFTGIKVPFYDIAVFLFISFFWRYYCPLIKWQLKKFKLL